MTHSHLAPCPSCSRHVRVNESSCVHCGATLSAAFRVRVRPRSVAGRLSRAALHALGVGAAGSSIGCTSTPAPLYGGPPMDHSPQDAGQGATAVKPPVNHDVPIAAYGGPPPNLPLMDGGRK